MPVRRALLSVYDKTGLEELARGLHEAGVALVSTGSTAARIAAAGRAGHPGRGAHRLPRVPRRAGQDAAPAGARGHPGRPAAGRPRAAARRPRHRGRSTWSWSTSTRSARPWPPAPRPTSASSRSTSAARRWCGPRRRTTRQRRRGRRPRVATPTVLAAVQAGGFDLAARRRLAAQAFAHTAAYDTAVASWCAAGADQRPAGGWPPLRRAGPGAGRRPALRREPAPAGRALRRPGRGRPGIAQARPAARQGDVLQQLRRRRRRAAGRVRLRPSRAVAIIKHANPCGIAVGADIAAAHAQGARLRPGVGVRRRDRGQPPGHRWRWPSRWPRCSPRWWWRRRSTTDALDLLTREEERAAARAARRAPAATPSSCARCRGGVLLQTADRVDAAGDDPATWTLAAGPAGRRRRARRPGVRLAGRAGR